MNTRRFAEYEVDPQLVAEAMLRRIDRMADDRAAHTRALIDSVEVLVAPDWDGPSAAI